MQIRRSTHGAMARVPFFAKEIKLLMNDFML